VTEIQRQMKKREREADKYKTRFEDQVKTTSNLEKENNELKNQIKKSNDSKEDLNYKLQQIQKEKDEILRQLKELEIYKKFSKGKFSSCYQLPALPGII